MNTNIRTEGWYEKCYRGNKMKESRFKLGINYTDRPSVIIPIRISGIDASNITLKDVSGQLPKSPLSPPEIHSPETIGK